MALKLIPPGQGGNLREYYIRFGGSMYGVLHVDIEAHTVNLVHLKELDNVPVFVEPLDPYKLHCVRVFDSSSFRMVLCFFDRFYVTVGDMHVLEFDSPQAYMEHMHTSLYDVVLFPPVEERQETNPWRTLSRSDDVGSLWLCDFSPAEEGVNPGPDSCSTRTLCRLRREVDGSLTLKPARSFAICEAWEENNCSTSSWRLTSVRKRTTL
jgi:hypothetical protein|nr:MAG TPA: hypothetical protein [Caudoviricetes sp.]